MVVGYDLSNPSAESDGDHANACGHGFTGTETFHAEISDLTGLNRAAFIRDKTADLNRAHLEDSPRSVAQSTNDFVAWLYPSVHSTEITGGQRSIVGAARQKSPAKYEGYASAQHGN